jgi:uncharacterized protein
MSEESIIKQTEEHVKKTLENESSGHDWWHVYRVWRMALKIAKGEKNVDLFVIQLAALLHDISDWKFNRGDESIGPKLARKWLEESGIEENTILHVCEIIKEVSFKGAKAKSRIRTKEGMIVQDADRLDAMGAIGISRVFVMGAKFNEIIYDPRIDVPKYKNADEYIKAKGKKGRTVINHFYEKLLLLKDLMNTRTGRKIAEKRHKFMKIYLDKFFEEWEGED